MIPANPALKYLPHVDGLRAVAVIGVLRLGSLIPCLGAVLVIGYGRRGPAGWLLQRRATVWIGLISYSLYLVHWPLLVYVTYRLPDPPSLEMRLALFQRAEAEQGLIAFLRGTRVPTSQAAVSD